jgi:hypothetical protein
VNGPHLLDCRGGGTVRLDPPALAVTAYDVYFRHVWSCNECRRRLHNCDEGRELWEAYIATRPLPCPVIGRRPQPGGER